jgi:hypothetical protein
LTNFVRVEIRRKQLAGIEIYKFYTEVFGKPESVPVVASWYVLLKVISKLKFTAYPQKMSIVKYL